MYILWSRSVSTWMFTRSFNMCSQMMETLYQSVVVSAVNFAVVCWRRSIRACDTNRLNKPTRKAGSVIGCKLDTSEAAVERRSLNKLLSTYCDLLPQGQIQENLYTHTLSPSIIQSIWQNIICSLI